MIFVIVLFNNQSTLYYNSKPNCGLTWKSRPLQSNQIYKHVHLSLNFFKILLNSAMLGKRSRPVISKLAASFASGNNAGVSDAAMSPKSPLEFKSSRGLKNYDLGGVGLGIVAALEKYGDGGGEIRTRYAVCSLNLNRSDPIPMNSARISAKFKEGLEDESLEDHSFTTCHGPTNNSVTKVYSGCGHDRNGFDRRSKNLGVFSELPARFADVSPVFPTSEFLNSCDWCRKELHGKDIYMYRGEKAFCSTECRYRQIVIDERKEQCKSEASRAAADVSSSPLAPGQIFSTGIVVI